MPEDTSEVPQEPPLESSRKAESLYHDTRLKAATYAAAKHLWVRCLISQERLQLGGNIETAFEKHGGAVKMWMHLRGVSRKRAVVEVGEAIGILTTTDMNWLLRELGELPRDPVEAQAVAIKRGDLVVERRPPTVYWKGDLIDIDWSKHGTAWNFLVLACEHAQRGEPIDRLSFGDHARENIVTQEKSRLKSIAGFPSELIGLFEIVAPRTQRLKLSPERVHLF